LTNTPMQQIRRTGRKLRRLAEIRSARFYSRYPSGRLIVSQILWAVPTVVILFTLVTFFLIQLAGTASGPVAHPDPSHICISSFTDTPDHGTEYVASWASHGQLDQVEEEGR